MLTLTGVSAGEVDANSSSGYDSSISVEPTYTLVYAIIGIIIVVVLFYTGYIKSDD